jgi:hypothetical protein
MTSLYDEDIRLATSRLARRPAKESQQFSANVMTRDVLEMGEPHHSSHNEADAITTKLDRASHYAYADRRFLFDAARLQQAK